MSASSGQVALPDAVRADVLKKLKSVDNKQDSIQGISRHALKKCEYARDWVKVWRKALDEVPAKRVLSLLYVANDIMQTCKRIKGGDAFLSAFLEIMEDALVAAISMTGSSGAKKVVRILDVLAQRKVVKRDVIMVWKRAIRKKRTSNAAGKEREEGGKKPVEYANGQDAGTPPGSPPRRLTRKPSGDSPRGALRTSTATMRMMKMKTASKRIRVDTLERV